MKKKSITYNLEPRTYPGFTLIELLVVISIMTILVAVISINLAGQRAMRDIRIAQNQLVTNIRKVQSYTLSSRTLPSGESAQYYILKFDLNNPTQYTIQAISNVSTQPKLHNLETIILPPNIQIATITPATYPINIARSLNPTAQPIFSRCALAAFAAPFGKITFNDGCNPVSFSSPYTLQLSEDYYAKIINFQTNVACDGNNGNPPNPAVCSASTDSTMIIMLTDIAKTISKTVTINGITRSITFN